MNRTHARPLATAILAVISFGCKPAIKDSPTGLENTPSPVLNPEAADIRLSQTGGKLREFENIYISFPVDMVDSTAVGNPDLEDEESPPPVVPPIVFDPNPGYWFSWITPRRGVIRVDGYFPEVAYRLTLRPGLTDRDGNPVNPDGWGAELASEDFGVEEVCLFNARHMETSLGPDQDLPALPRARLTFSRDVFPSEVARQVAFIDTESGARHPVVACLDEWQTGKQQGLVFVQPREPLPTGRRYWLVVERLKAAAGSHQTNYLRVYPAGYCAPHKSVFARGYNQPRRGTFARVFFNQAIDRAALDVAAFKVTPPVSGLTAEAEGKVVLLHGDFRQGVEYAVHVAPGVVSAGGFPTPESAEWRIQIPERRASIVLPSDYLAQPLAGGVDVGFSHSRTASLKWTLAEVTPENLAEVRKRLREFAEPAHDDKGDRLLDPRDGTLKFTPTELLIPALALKVVAGDALAPAPGDDEVAARVQWKPDDRGVIAGLYLLEIEGTDAEGRACGNRMLVSLSDWFMNFVSTFEGCGVRLSRLADGRGVPGVSVHAMGSKGELLAEAGTDTEGFARFTTLEEGASDPAMLLAGNDRGRCFQEGAYPARADDGRDYQSKRQYRSLLVTNGDLFEPGEDVQLYAIVRENTDGVLSLPAADADFSLNIMIGSDDEPDATEHVPLAVGSGGTASLRWHIPDGLIPSRVFFSLKKDGESFATAAVDVTEFRPPAFSMDLSATTRTGTTAEAKLTSRFFHGSANRGATVTWTAEWILQDWLPASYPDLAPDPERFYFAGELRHHSQAVDSLSGGRTRGGYFGWEDFVFTDRYSESASRQGMEGVLAGMKLDGGSRFARNLAVPSSHPVRGEVKLDETGETILRCECPFPEGGQPHRAQVLWTVDLKTAAGVSRRASVHQRIQFPEKALAVKAVKRAQGDRGLPIEILTIGADNNVPPGGGEAEVEVFLRRINTVQESLSETVVRYRNVPEFRSVWKKRLGLPFEGVLPADAPGDYIVTVTPVDMPRAVAVSVPFFGVRGQSEMAVTDDSAFEAVLEKEELVVGDTARITVRTPFPGALRVTLETDKLLESLPVIQMEGTATTVEVPVRKGYFPKAFARLHLMGKGSDGIPAERFTLCPLGVRDPDLELKVSPVVAKPLVRVRDTVSGEVLVTARGKAVADAEVTVFAIDEAVLSLGNWVLPDTRSPFYPDTDHTVVTNLALGKQWAQAEAQTLSQFEKGYILGAGREKILLPTVILRENERPRPLFVTSLRTDSSGRVPFTFVAPDSLTSYRIAALASTRSHQFGAGESTVRVSNPLRAEPVLPQFVREGDELVLRCQLTQEAVPSLPVDFSITLEGNATLQEGAAQRLTLGRDEAQTVTARLKAGPAKSGEDLRVIFKALAADGSGLADATAVGLALLPRLTERTEILSGSLAAGATWDAAKSVRPEWSEQPGGVVDVLLSGTEWLPHLATFSPGARSDSGVTDLASSALAPYLVPRLAAYLPWEPDAESTGEGSGVPPRWLREKSAAEALAAIEVLEKSLIPDDEAGWLPQFPGGDVPDDPATALVAWAVKFAAGETSPEGVEGEESNGSSFWSKRLLTKLAYWRGDTIEGYRAGDQPVPTPFVRAVTLFAEALGPELEETHPLRVTARALFSHREKDLGLEGRCFLGMAVALLNEQNADQGDAVEEFLTAEEWQTLLAEIEDYPLPEDFDPQTLGTPQRAAAIRLLALARIKGEQPGAKEALSSERLAKELLIDGRPLTAQESIWRLLAADSYLALENPATLAGITLERNGALVSPNGVTLGWMRQPPTELAGRFPEGLRVSVPAAWLLRATFRSALPAPTGNASLSLARDVHAPENAERTGTADHPFRIGDYVLLSYHVRCQNDSPFVLIEEELPAALESVNPDLPSVRKAFSLPENPSDAVLAHAEHGSHRVRLTFASLPAGESTYTVLTQVVAGGTFAWPAAQATLLYDQRLTATTADALVYSAP